MTTLIFPANQVRLVGPSDLAVGDVVRMVDERSPFKIGIFLGADGDNSGFLFAALDGERRYFYWAFDADIAVLRIVSADKLHIKLDITQPSVQQIRAPGVISASVNGMMMCFKEAGSGITPKKLLSFLDRGFTDARFSEGSYLAYENWSLGTINAVDEFIEVSSSRTDL